MNYTDEQLAAAEAFAKGNSLKVGAFAGTGKTTLLRYMAERVQGRGLYIAYNNQIARESASKFPSHVTCKTAHAIALDGLPRELREKASQGNRLTQGALARYLQQRAGLVEIDAREIAPVVAAAMHWFCVSADPYPTLSHVERALQTVHTAVGPEEILSVLPAVWEGISTVDGGLPLTFDGYLKFYQLMGANLPADYVLADEAQDMFPAIQFLILRSAGQTAWVGDSNQQLYEFNGADDAMQRLEGLETYPLTLSFRFGEWLADLVQPILAQLGESETIRGNPEITTTRAKRPLQVRLARGNVSLLTPLVAAVSAGKRVHVLGGVAKLNALLDDVESVMIKRRVQTGPLAGIGSWHEARERAAGRGNRVLRDLVGLVEKHRLREVRRCVDAVCKGEGDARIVLSTVHQAKGREFDKVALIDDFRQRQEVLFTFRGEDFYANSPEILRLLYVALTRARDEVFVPMALAKRYEFDRELQSTRCQTETTVSDIEDSHSEEWMTSAEAWLQIHRKWKEPKYPHADTSRVTRHDDKTETEEPTDDWRLYLVVAVTLLVLLGSLKYMGYLDFLPFA